MSYPRYTSGEVRCYWPDVRTLWRGFWAWLNFMRPAAIEPNPLPILMRAINAVRARFVIRQPCWRKGRWRSTT